jgi:WD and tetratricopeptide repeat-containing protein 1
MTGSLFSLVLSLFRETDIRLPSEEAGVLINLNSDVGEGIEAKCLSINPAFPEYLAVGTANCYVRMYDRRKLKRHILQFPCDEEEMRDRRNFLKTEAIRQYDWDGQLYAKYFVAGHLPYSVSRRYWPKQVYSTTYVTFSPNGQELLANMGGEQIYLFDVFHGDPLLMNTFKVQKFLDNCDSTPTEGN